MMKLSRFGIFTFGSVWAFMTSVSPISLFCGEDVGDQRIDLVVVERARLRAHGIARRMKSNTVVG